MGARVQDASASVKTMANRPGMTHYDESAGMRFLQSGVPFLFCSSCCFSIIRLILGQGFLPFLSVFLFRALDCQLSALRLKPALSRVNMYGICGDELTQVCAY